jgi:hypothetical protein
MRRLLLASSLLLATDALAARSLVEEPSIAKAAAKAQKALVDDALAKAGATERCARGLKTEGIVGLECRAHVALAVAMKAALDKPSDVEARLAFAADLQKTAASVRAFEPLAPAPGFARQRFETHRALSRGALALIDEVGALPAQHAARARADELLKGPPRRIEGACVAVRDSLDLSGGADASLEERGALQGLLTSHRCFLDESRLTSAPKPGEALKNNADANSVKSSVGDAGALRQYAESRALDLGRCTGKHLDAAGRPTDKPKLEECVCGVIKRWTFPPRASETRVALPLGVGGLHVDIVAAPSGRTTACGPVTTQAPAP